MSYERITCPRCRRGVPIRARRYAIHSIVPRGDIQCRMSWQLVPVTGVDEEAYETRAAIVADLACQMQDVDPLLVWDYLTAVPASELQRLLMVALAGIPLDRRIDDIFSWVHQLPVAQGRTA
ncbi:DUF7368 family protein [Mycolicibacterium sphagni]|uniref:Uncharacterized protein n=1 Tax=Mycolicibacterium sphagni TaxID=1786 RepID=A0A255DIR3_9MYCO|nr:hypothetical protein [Mycolicibacterium sphagni]OYN76842.1 hypothetical protein CG716_20220 [Mycolicibacterium sphagni]